jgi:hypothetical protein
MQLSLRWWSKKQAGFGYLLPSLLQWCTNRNRCVNAAVHACSACSSTLCVAFPAELAVAAYSTVLDCLMLLPAADLLGEALRGGAPLPNV